MPHNSSLKWALFPFCMYVACKHCVGTHIWLWIRLHCYLLRQNLSPSPGHPGPSSFSFPACPRNQHLTPWCRNYSWPLRLSRFYIGTGVPKSKFHACKVDTLPCPKLSFFSLDSLSSSSHGIFWGGSPNLIPLIPKYGLPTPQEVSIYSPTA